jgi:hypothetical protein
MSCGSHAATALALAAAVLIGLPPSTGAQAPAAGASTALTRTPDGQPDIQGFWGTDAYAADMETGLPDDETATLQGQGDVDRSKEVSLVIDPADGRIPYQPWAAARRVSIPTFRRGQTSRGTPATVRDIRPRTFCLHGTPRNMTTDFQVVQTPQYVIFMWEFNHAYRIIPLDNRPRLPSTVKLAMGDSRGRWEGDTLVVESTNFREDGWLDVNGAPLTSSGKLIERFRRPNFGTLEIDITIDDPEAYTRPWTVRVNQRLLADTELIEFVCLENQKFNAAPAK